MRGGRRVSNRWDPEEALGKVRVVDVEVFIGGDACDPWFRLNLPDNYTRHFQVVETAKTGRVSISDEHGLRLRLRYTEFDRIFLHTEYWSEESKMWRISYRWIFGTGSPVP